ncbi:hypothetical protein A2U01_0022995 [Trifolium medium]|uniref:Uncharacterized protein n=1 Tax=Trifolium medium TaxID=97028 RepID=A0A392NU08_9FABA|nr:hypothetical protein [Trifolium medium]
MFLYHKLPLDPEGTRPTQSLGRPSILVKSELEGATRSRSTQSLGRPCRARPNKRDHLGHWVWLTIQVWAEVEGAARSQSTHSPGRPCRSRPSRKDRSSHIQPCRTACPPGVATLMPRVLYEQEPYQGKDDKTRECYGYYKSYSQER